MAKEPRQWLGRLGLAWFSLAGLGGCSSETLALKTDFAHQRPTGDEAEIDGFSPVHFRPPEFSDPEPDQLENTYIPPFPGRKNPFEFGAEFANETRSTEGTTDANAIRLFGFIGDAPARVVLNVSGRTTSLAAGERWGVIEITEVEPPNVKIRVNGVIRTWSLLGSSDGTPGG
jgi:hypothetical protein